MEESDSLCRSLSYQWLLLCRTCVMGTFRKVWIERCHYHPCTGMDGISWSISSLHESDDSDHSKAAATPLIASPTIAPIFFFRGGSEFMFPGGPSGFIVCAGTLTKYPGQERKNGGYALHELHSQWPKHST